MNIEIQHKTATTLTQAKRLIVKVGSSLLMQGKDGSLNTAWMATLGEDLAAARARDQDVILVSSGAIALGRGCLGLSDAPLSLEQSQAAAAAGQISLAHAWQEALSPQGMTIAQILLTLEDTEQRRRYLNARSTLNALLDFNDSFAASNPSEILIPFEIEIATPALAHTTLFWLSVPIPFRTFMNILEDEGMSTPPLISSGFIFSSPNSFDE